MKCLLLFVLVLLVMIVALGGYVWSGSYHIGADVPHWPITEKLLHIVRERSIETRIDAINVPQLDSPAMIAVGAEHYAGMCTGCHLAPGRDASEMRKGLYPKPPKLTRYAPDPAEAFWVIKHGIKMSGMPAWGITHSDDKIWAMVAYLQQQPAMSVERYRELTGSGLVAEMHPHEHEHEHEHAVVGDAEIEHSHEHEQMSEGG